MTNLSIFIPFVFFVTLNFFIDLLETKQFLKSTKNNNLIVYKVNKNQFKVIYTYISKYVTLQCEFCVIGECFVMLKKDMTRVYAPYCKNHDDVLQLLEKVRLI